VMSSRGRSLALGDRLAVSLATAKRLPSVKDSLLSPDARTSKAFSDGHMLLSIDSYVLEQGCFSSHLLSFDNNKVLKIINWIC